MKMKDNNGWNANVSERDGMYASLEWEPSFQINIQASNLLEIPAPGDGLAIKFWSPGDNDADRRKRYNAASLCRAFAPKVNKLISINWNLLLEYCCW